MEYVLYERIWLLLLYYRLYSEWFRWELLFVLKFDLLLIKGSLITARRNLLVNCSLYRFFLCWCVQSAKYSMWREMSRFQSSRVSLTCLPQDLTQGYCSIQFWKLYFRGVSKLIFIPFSYNCPHFNLLYISSLEILLLILCRCLLRGVVLLLVLVD